MIRLFIIAAVLLSNAWATTQSLHAGKDSMNGIKFADYKNFSQEWTLVTIRFRKDTGEMRLTYANPLAFQTLKDGKTNYPEGSVFAKTGVLTGVDSQFPSSVVPRAIRRYQLMVKNGKQYAETNGWGYALFDADGKTYPEEPVAAQQACHACHMMVENRGYVFSEPFNFTMGAKFAQVKSTKKTQLMFQTLALNKLGPSIRLVLPKNTKRVRFLMNTQLRRHVFQGTLDEVKPLLEMEALAAEMPAVFASDDSKRFAIVWPLKRIECLNEKGAEMVSTMSDGKLMSQKVCLHD